ncbi:MAG: type V CRISPR-associated protein Cas12a/Cpf1 [Bacteroides sp.]|nr:type V CRISPR-associated protein Cas12a/Cpf1 [Prevotella sp.]MCM1407166.1 type V CRISPR-associated protein Cas12a/Cpf1 [Treponema brennaborense]MCM1470318.1 type V CRISPR-associated protein Cas12a/Cpf1 [Bacteroides sp.]
MKISEQFCGQENGYSISKTLRFELKPQAATLENIEKAKLLESDFKKSQDYKDVKVIIDNYHKYFIDDVLQNVNLDWTKLADALIEYSKTKEDDSYVKKEQDALRKEIVKYIKKDERFNPLTASTPKDLFNSLLPEWFEKNASLMLNEKAVETFRKFSSYFKGFQENRKNMYKEEEIPTAVPYRIVHDNFPKFLQNVNSFNEMQKKCPEVIEQVETELSVYLGNKKLSDIFNVQNYNNYLCQTGAEKQRGIDFYNQVIGGIVQTENDKKLRGINEFLNLYWQQNADFAKTNRKIKFIPLYKQILSDRTSLSFKIQTIDSDEELKESLLSFAEKMNSKNNEGKTVFTVVTELCENIIQFDLSKIYINQKDINTVSRILTGDWAYLQKRMNIFAEETLNKKEQKRWKKELDDDTSKTKGIFSFEELNAVLEYCSENCSPTTIRIQDYFGTTNRYYFDKQTEIFTKSEEIIEPSIKDLCTEIETNFVAMHTVFETVPSEKTLREKPADVEKIKSYLDSVQNLLHRIKPLKASGLGDANFYTIYDEVYFALSEVISLYNKTRNYIAKKANAPEKFKLNFDCPTLADGWDENKERENGAIILIKDEKYFLGIMNAHDKPKFQEKYESNGEKCYQKMVYKLLPGPNKMLPKVFFSKKGKADFCPPEEILSGYDKGLHKKGDIFDKQFCRSLIDFFKDAIGRHPDWKNFGFTFSDTASYKDISCFYREISEQGYKITFTDVPESYINSLVDEGKLYLFQIYNKDFAEGANGTPNMHTLYWKNLFSKENLQDTVFKLNGEAELFYREKGIKEPIVHKKGSKLVNKITQDGFSIPQEIYEEIYKFENGTQKALSADAQKYADEHKVIVKTARHDITKDRRFAEPKFLFHVPITINFKAQGNVFTMNERVREFLKNNPDVNVIGLDRGERHLIYLSLINQKGEILKQFSFNEVERSKNGQSVKVNYHEKLDNREKERDAARKNWNAIGKIAELKEGYLSAVIHELAKLMIQYNAVIVMEDLNFGFKRGRFHVEKQVYQKFEKMLIDKLNYLVFKDKGFSEAGGVLNGYQLAGKFESFQKLGKQSGFLFYVPAAYTSKIDPKTGFVDLLNLRDLTNVHKKREFFSKFDEIRYDAETESFAFTFDYKNFDGKGKTEMAAAKWIVYSCDKRIAYSSKSKSYSDVYPTDEFKKIFSQCGINFEDGRNLIDPILEIGADLKDGERPDKPIADFWDAMLKNFKLILQMRNSNASTGEDYIISPVKNKDGTFFDSRKEKELGGKAKLPIDADANGAYHIALKGLLLLQRFSDTEDANLKKADLKISNADWFEFVQEKKYLK